MNIKDYKTSYNKLHNIYQVLRKDNVKGDWHRVTYEKKNLEFILDNNLHIKEHIKPLPYKPYFKYRVIWFIKYLYNKINGFEPKLRSLQKNGYTILIVGIISFLGFTFLIKKCSTKYNLTKMQNAKNQQEIKNEKSKELKNQTSNLDSLNQNHNSK